MEITIGIPRALLFYEYATLWIHFFERLGAKVVVSHPTNKKILNNGTSYCVDDACIPVKVYHGHVLDLVDHVDFLFAPRIIGVSKGDYICPKFCGLPEMIKYSIKNVPVLINTPIDFTKSDKHIKKTIYEIGHFITDDNRLIDLAYNEAIIEYKNEKKKIYHDLKLKRASSKPKIMIFGHPYILHDPYLNMNVVKKFEQNGFEVLTPHLLNTKELEQYSTQYQGKIFWKYSRELIGTCLFLIEHHLVDGVIFISSFGCGVDSLLTETIERRIRKTSHTPYMLLTIDEHSGEAGFNTRIEAYIDMLKWRLSHESHLSAHG